MVKSLPATAGDVGNQETCEMWVGSLGWEDSRGGWHGNPLQLSCLKNPMNRRTWWATVHGIARVGHTLLTKQQQPLGN